MLRRRSLPVLLATGVACLAACGGSGSPEGSLEVVVSPADFECEAEGTGVATQTCRPLDAVALVRCSPDRVSHELPAGMRERDVEAGEVCDRIDDEGSLLAPDVGESCAQPRGRVTVDGEFDGEPVRLALRTCTDTPTEADEWARLVGVPFADPPHE